MCKKKKSLKIENFAFTLRINIENLGGYLAYRDLIGYLTNGIMKDKDLIENSNKKD